MATACLVGVDGAGKTTVAEALVASSVMRIKYLYMGVNLESSNVLLPTSRLILFLKLRSYRRRAEREGISDPTFLTSYHPEHRQDRRGSLGAAMRTLNRFAEAWYRQFHAWVYQLRGWMVLYDRHPFFEVAAEYDAGQRLSDKVFRFLVSHLFPRPDLVIMLDAPPELLYGRKQEVPVSALQAKREALICQGNRIANFVTVDASRSPEEVYSEVEERLRALRSPDGGKS